MGDKYGKKPKNHFDDCYLLCSQHEGNQQEEESVGLSKPRVAISSISHCNEIPVPVFKGLSELELPGFEEDQAPFCPPTVVKTLFQMSVFLLLHYHSSFLKKNLMIGLEISNFPKNLLNF